MFFGSRDNLIMPGRAANMGDGWETRRRRGPGHDWAIVRLGAPAVVARVEIDTNHFKGNYPESASLEGCRSGRVSPGGTGERRAALAGGAAADEARPAHAALLRRAELVAPGPFTHVRLRIFPDGGVSRLRVHGRVDRA